MVRGFSRSHDEVIGRIDEQEREVIAALFEQTIELLESAAAPEDEEADDFRRMLRAAGLESGAPHPSGTVFGGGGIDEEALADPAIGRLLPDAHHDDPLAAAEFRRYSADGVRRAKIERLRTAATAMRGTEKDSPREVRLREPEAVAVLVALTDVRLVLASRLGIETEEDVDRLENRIASGQGDGLEPLAVTYDFLTWVQESLAGALETFE